MAPAAVLMIFVDEAGAFFPAISHSPWDGITLADFVMPFFLLIVGVALALTYKQNDSVETPLHVQRVSNKAAATKKAVLRAMKLFIVGLIVQGMQLFLVKLNYFIVSVIHKQLKVIGIS
ncbi:hypothetical protein GW17_00055647 [Ensete ventricosum]|nr:hypothetical protein GW17_00055647 [Ensete ventricosum]